MKKQTFLLKTFFTLSLILSSTAALADWAVIVFNPQTSAWGSAANSGASYRADVEQSAMNFCGSTCAGITPYQLENKLSPLVETYGNNGQWVALAIDGHGHFGTSGLHGSQSDAEASAYQNCTNGGGINCYVIRSLSSYYSGTNVNN